MVDIVIFWLVHKKWIFSSTREIKPNLFFYSVFNLDSVRHLFKDNHMSISYPV